MGIFFGSAFADMIEADDIYNAVFGFAGRDTIDAPLGINLIFAGAGDDDVTGIGNLSIAFGGAGDDRIAGGVQLGPFAARTGSFIVGGPGEDTVVYEASEGSADVRTGPLGTTIVQTGFNTDVIFGAEFIAFNDATIPI